MKANTPCDKLKLLNSKGNKNIACAEEKYLQMLQLRKRLVHKKIEKDPVNKILSFDYLDQETIGHMTELLWRMQNSVLLV